jgi:hypothetical protein
MFKFLEVVEPVVVTNSISSLAPKEWEVDELKSLKDPSEDHEEEDALFYEVVS